MAMTKLMETGGMLTGIIYQDKMKKSYEDLVVGFKQEGLAKHNMKITEDEFNKLVAEFK
jgi:2-oxoglutarate ferredoxin oxidoreductase subunit beta